VVSLAVPVNEGVVSFVRAGGAFSVTVGGAVSILNVRDSLTPSGFPSELSCLATAVYCPSARAGLAPLELQLPPVPPAVALATGEPVALGPGYIQTTTSVVSLAVPVNDGVVSLKRAGGALSVTWGEEVSIVNVRGSLTPSGFLSELFCVACAVY
jgi:hypothetical protein